MRIVFITGLTFICVVIWGSLFVTIVGSTFEEEVLISRDNMILNKFRGNDMVALEDPGRFNKEEIISHTSVLSYSETKVGDAISYGEGISIDYLLEQFTGDE